MAHDGHNRDAVNWRESGYYALCISSIAIGYLLTFILIKTMTVTEHRKSMMTNKYAFFLLIIIIFFSFYRPVVMWAFIFDLNSSCTELSKHIDQGVLFLGIVMRWFMILKCVEINFQNFPLLAYSNRFILGLKISMIIFAVIAMSIRIRFFPVEFSSHHLKSQSDIHVCVQSADKTTVSNHLSLAIAFITALIGLHIYLCALFIRKANQLYFYIKQSIKPTSKRKIVEGIEKLSRVIQPIFRLTILVVTITLSLFLFVFLRRMVAPKGIPLDSMDNLITGLSCIAMFPFGTWYFNFFCGCLQRRLINRWLNKEIKFFNNETKMIEQRRIDSNQIELSVMPKEKSNQDTHPHASSSTDNSLSLEIPTFDDWKSIEESMEKDVKHMKRFRLNIIVENESDEDTQNEKQTGSLK